MRYTIDKQERYAVMHIQHDNLNSVVSPDLKSELFILRNEEVAHLILDLSEVQFVDSSGLSSILTGHRLWKDFGLFILTGLKSENVKKLITISKLENVFIVVPTLQESIDLVMMEELEREIKGPDPE